MADSKIRNIRTLKALRGDALSIDLGNTYTGTMEAWMKKDPNDVTYRPFTIVDNRYLTLTAEETSDYYSGLVLDEAVEGRWYFDVELTKDGETSTIYTGTIIFANDVTQSNGVQASPITQDLATLHTVTIEQIGHGLSIGDAIKFDDTTKTYIKAQANNKPNANCIGIVNSVIDIDNFVYQFGGVYNATATTEGRLYYLSPVTPGGISQTPTFSSGDWVQYLGVSTDEGLLLNIDFGHEYGSESITSISEGDGISIVETSPGNFEISADGTGGDADLTQTITQNLHGLSVGDVVKLNGATYTKAQADVANNANAIAIVTDVENANVFTIQAQGYTNANLGLIDGVEGFLSSTHSGKITSTVPANGEISVYLGQQTPQGFLINISTGFIVGYNGGDMSKSEYDPTGVSGDAFDMDNMNQGINNQFIGTSDRTLLDNTSGVNTGDQDISGIAQNESAINTLELNNTGVNTGDQDLSGISNNANAISVLEVNNTGVNTGDQDISGIANNASSISVLEANNTGVNTGDQDLSGISNNASAILTLETNNTGVNTGDQDISGIAINASDIDALELNNTGVNTGDQDLSGLALKTNVLELDNTEAFTPNQDYEPATKKYVDDQTSGESYNEWATYVGERAVGDLVATIGDYDNTGNGTNLKVNDDTSEIIVDGNLKLVNSKFITSANASGTFKTSVEFVEATSDNDIQIPNASGTIALTSDLISDTDELPEGSTNLYYTSARFDTDLGTKTSDDLIEGSTNLYMTPTEAATVANLSGTNTGDQDLSGLALKTNVLELDNTDAFTPSSDYEPATKKYVDDNSGGGGADLAKNVTQAAHGFSVGNVIKLNGSVYELALADNPDNANAISIVIAVDSVNDFTIQSESYISVNLGLTNGDEAFLSTTVAGNMQIISPTDGEVNVYLGQQTPQGFLINISAGFIVDSAEGRLEKWSKYAGSWGIDGVLSLGDIDDLGNSTKVQIDDENDLILLNNSSSGQIQTQSEILIRNNKDLVFTDTNNLYTGSLSSADITSARIWSFRDQDGTIAFTSELGQSTLQEVTDNGASTTNDISLNSSDLLFNDGTYNAILRNGTLASSVVLTLPTTAGTFALISDSTYSGSWNGDTEHAASKNAIYDQLQNYLTSSNLQDTLDTGNSASGVDTFTDVLIDVEGVSSFYFKKSNGNVNYGIDVNSASSKLYSQDVNSMAMLIATGGEVMMSVKNNSDGSTTIFNIPTAATDTFEFKANLPRPTLTSNLEITMPISINNQYADANGNIVVSAQAGVNTVLEGDGISVDTPSGNVTVSLDTSGDWFKRTGSRGSNLVLELGDYDTSENGTLLTVDDLNQIITIDSKSLVLRDSDASAFKATIALDYLSSDLTYTMPTSSGQFALLSDISGGSSKWSDVTTGGIGYDSGFVGVGYAVGDTMPRMFSVKQGSSGLVADFRSGSGTTCNISLSNNTSTADAVRIGSEGTSLTLSTNYSPKLTILNSGYVGIGDDITPEELLHLDGGNLRIDSSSGTPTSTATIELRNNPDMNGSIVQSIRTNIGESGVDSGTSGLQFLTNSNSVSTPGVAMTITAKKSVGIGTDTPSEVLEVVGNVKGTSFITDSNITSITDADINILPDGAGELKIGSTGNGSLIWHYGAPNAEGTWARFQHTGGSYQIDTSAGNGIKFNSKTTCTSTSEATALITTGASITDLITGTGSTIGVGTAGQVLTVGSGATALEWADASSGGGDVNKVGTPLNNQVSIWTGDGTVEGDNNFTWNSSTQTLDVDFKITTSLIELLQVALTDTTTNNNSNLSFFTNVGTLRTQVLSDSDDFVFYRFPKRRNVTGSLEEYRDVAVEVILSGNTSKRPDNLNSDSDVGLKFFDKDLDRPIWWNGANWVKNSNTDEWAQYTGAYSSGDGVLKLGDVAEDNNGSMLQIIDSDTEIYCYEAYLRPHEDYGIMFRDNGNSFYTILWGESDLTATNTVTVPGDSTGGGKISLVRYGTTAERPTWASNEYVGESWLDTTLGKPIWWNGTNWIDATGTTV